MPWYARPRRSGFARYARYPEKPLTKPPAKAARRRVRNPSISSLPQKRGNEHLDGHPSDREAADPHGLYVSSLIVSSNPSSLCWLSYRVPREVLGLVSTHRR